MFHKLRGKYSCFHYWDRLFILFDRTQQNVKFPFAPPSHPSFSLPLSSPQKTSGHRAYSQVSDQPPGAQCWPHRWLQVGCGHVCWHQEKIWTASTTIPSACHPTRLKQTHPLQLHWNKRAYESLPSWEQKTFSRWSGNVLCDLLVQITTSNDNIDGIMFKKYVNLPQSPGFFSGVVVWLLFIC